MSIENSVRGALESAIAEGMTPGAVCEVSVGGVAVEPIIVGAQGTIDECGAPLAPEERESVLSDTRYDVASVTKLFSALTMLRLVDAGSLDLDSPISEWLNEYRTHAKSGVTLRHLLTHTSGLPGTWDGWHAYIDNEGTPDARWRTRDRNAALKSIVELPLNVPTGTAYEYSCMGYITAMACAETATGRGWEGLVTEQVLDPLGLTETGFGATGAAPTEYEPKIGRGLVRGVVHDEAAFALEGVSANAGLFSTAGDLRRFGESMTDGFVALLTEESSRGFWTDQLPDVLSRGRPPDWGQGLGPRIGQNTLMTSGLRSARGHAGFTGPCVIVDRGRGLVISLVTNRVHPTRHASDGSVLRWRVSRAVLDALAS
ncbi:MAG: beta-lactamase family protein [Kineosporiaceae bacterium]|nr:beta-lactamase family protein [Aeromicrobium sp.]